MDGYIIPRAMESIPVDSNWDKPAWQEVAPLELTHFMGLRPAHFPRVQARLLYSFDALQVIFSVHDRFVLATATAHQQAVYRDSCVEFFFTPGRGPGLGYFNLEMNCGGRMLFHYQTAPRQGSAVKAADLARIEVAHSLPRIVEPEMQEPVHWTVEYRLPLAVLERYCRSLIRPAPGVMWRGNFYKCADGTSHPHWLTWARVDQPQPDFHRPDRFGELVFD